MKKIALFTYFILQTSLSLFAQQDSIEFHTTVDAFLAACPNPSSLTFEDFEGGPADDFLACGTAVSSMESECFPAGEIQEGVIFTNSGASVGAEMLFVNSGSFFGLANPGIASNNFFSSTYVLFTGNVPVHNVAFDLYSPIGSGAIDLRIYGVSTELLLTVTYDASNIAQFVGFSSVEAIERIELQNPGNTLIETVAQFYFGDCELVLSTNEAEPQNITIFPNPVIDELTITSETLVERVRIFKVNGQEVFTRNANAKSLSTNLSHLNPGVYFVKIYSKDLVKTVKIIKI